MIDEQRYDPSVADEPRVITAAEFDRMTPNERAACFAEGIVTDWEQVPDGFRERVEATAKRLATERETGTTQ